jgi:hypothetical protein
MAAKSTALYITVHVSLMERRRLAMASGPSAFRSTLRGLPRRLVLIAMHNITHAATVLCSNPNLTTRSPVSQDLCYLLQRCSEKLRPTEF